MTHSQGMFLFHNLKIRILDWVIQSIEVCTALNIGIQAIYAMIFENAAKSSIMDAFSVVPSGSIRSG